MLSRAIWGCQVVQSQHCGSTVWRHHGMQCYHLWKHIFILLMAQFMSSLISKHPISWTVIRQMLYKTDQLLMLATVFFTSLHTIEHTTMCRTESPCKVWLKIPLLSLAQSAVHSSEAHQGMTKGKGSYQSTLNSTLNTIVKVEFTPRVE